MAYRIFFILSFWPCPHPPIILLLLSSLHLVKLNYVLFPSVHTLVWATASPREPLTTSLEFSSGITLQKTFSDFIRQN